MEATGVGESGLGSGTVRTIDVDDISRSLQWVTTTNPILVFGGMLLPGLLTAEIIRTHDLAAIRPDYLLSCLVIAFAAIIAWRNRNGVDALSQPMTLLSLSLVAIICVVAMGYNIGAFEVFWLWPSFQTGAAAVAVVTLRRTFVPTSNVSLAEITREPANQLRKAPQAHAKPRNPYLGTVLILLGFALFLGGAMILDGFFAGPLLPLCGAASLLLARGCFEPAADDVLSLDTRPPVVFLRAFADDESINFFDVRSSLIDLSIEDRLARHFSATGPFIAVGAPKKKKMVIGASRAFLSDAEWQERVRSWIARAEVILWSAGGTNWVFWELEQIIALGKVDRLIIVLPRKVIDPSARLLQLISAFKGTAWEPALAKIQDPSDLRSILFGSDGGLTVVTASTTNRNSYHIAVLVAHYFMRKKDTTGGPYALPAGQQPAGPNPLEVASVQVSVLTIMLGIVVVARAMSLTVSDLDAVYQDPVVHVTLGVLALMTLFAPIAGVIGFLRRGRQRADVSLGLLFSFGWLFFAMGFTAQALQSLRIFD